MKKFLLSVLIVLLLPFNSAFAEPVEDYSDYDFLPLYLNARYNVYNLGDEILVYASGTALNYGGEKLDSWTFMLDDNDYPIKDIRFFTKTSGYSDGDYLVTDYSEIPLHEVDQNMYSFDIDSSFDSGSGLNTPRTDFYFLALLENPNSKSPIEWTDVPVVVHPADSSARFFIHHTDEVLGYDFGDDGYFEVGFEDQVKYLMDFLEKDIEDSDIDIDRLTKIIFRSNPGRWVRGSAPTIEGYDEEIKALVEEATGRKGKDSSNSDSEPFNWEFFTAVGGGILLFLVVLFYIYKKRAVGRRVFTRSDR